MVLEQKPEQVALTIIDAFYTLEALACSWTGSFHDWFNHCAPRLNLLANSGREPLLQYSPVKHKRKRMRPPEIGQPNTEDLYGFTNEPAGAK